MEQNKQSINQASSKLPRRNIKWNIEKSAKHLPTQMQQLFSTIYQPLIYRANKSFSLIYTLLGSSPGEDVWSGHPKTECDIHMIKNTQSTLFRIMMFSGYLRESGPILNPNGFLCSFDVLINHNDFHRIHTGGCHEGHSRHTLHCTKQSYLTILVKRLCLVEVFGSLHDFLSMCKHLEYNQGCDIFDVTLKL